MVVFHVKKDGGLVPISMITKDPKEVPYLIESNDLEFAFSSFDHLIKLSIKKIGKLVTSDVTELTMVDLIYKIGKTEEKEVVSMPSTNRGGVYFLNLGYSEEEDDR